MNVTIKSNRPLPTTTETRRVPKGKTAAKTCFKLDLPDYEALATVASEANMSLSCATVQIINQLLDALNASGELEVCTGYRIPKGQTRQQKNLSVTFTTEELERLDKTADDYGLSTYRLFVSLIDTYVKSL